MKRDIFTIRQTAHVVVASVLVELMLDFGAGALAVVLASQLGSWVYAVAGVIVVGSLPVLGLNIARMGRREWRLHRFADRSWVTRCSPREADGGGIILLRFYARFRS